MSIQYNVAAALIRRQRLGAQLHAARTTRALHRLIGVTTLQIDDEMTQAYPGKQGGDVEVREDGGATHRVRAGQRRQCDARPTCAIDSASPPQRVLGAQRAREIERFIDGLDHSDDAGHLGDAAARRGWLKPAHGVAGERTPAASRTSCRR